MLLNVAQDIMFKNAETDLSVFAIAISVGIYIMKVLLNQEIGNVYTKKVNSAIQFGLNKVNSQITNSMTIHI